MAVKIAVTRVYEDEKRHVHSNRLLFVAKKLTALSDMFFNFGGYAPDWSNLSFTFKFRIKPQCYDKKNKYKFYNPLT